MSRAARSVASRRAGGSAAWAGSGGWAAFGAPSENMDMISPHASLVQRVIVGSAPYVLPSVAVHRRPAGTAAAAGGAAPGSTGVSPTRALRPRGSPPSHATASEGGAPHDPPDAGAASRLARGGRDRGDSLGALGAAVSTGSVVAVDVANARGSGTIDHAGAGAGAALVARARAHRARASPS